MGLKPLKVGGSWGRVQAVHSLDTALLGVLLWAEPGIWGIAQFGVMGAKYSGWASQDEQRQVWILWDAPVLCTGTTGLEAGTSSRRAQGITRGGC